MRIFHGLPAASSRRDCALTIGNFDGVHRGHQALLARLHAEASARGLAAVVCTFEPHPREYFAALAHARAQAGPQATAQAPGRRSAVRPTRIATLRDKIGTLAACGIDAVCLLRFDAALAAMPAERFVARVLAEGLRTRHLLIGDDFRFGAHRTGDFELLRALGPRHGFSVERMDTVTDLAPRADSAAEAAGGDEPATEPAREAADGSRISSSALREALAGGDLGRARALLGRPYAVTARVLHGRKLGRALGFPTLNQRLWRPDAHARLRPALSGVFAVRVHGLPGAGSAPLPGVASLGTRPAVERDGAWLLETHVFDYAHDAYGRCVRVEFVAKLRDEAHFDTLEALTAQIDRDARAARRLLDATDATSPDPTDDRRATVGLARRTPDPEPAR